MSPEPRDLWLRSPARTNRGFLLVATAGGHLAELCAWRERLHLDGPHVWATFSTPQSRALLSGAEVLELPYTRPRDIVGALSSYTALLTALRSRPDLSGVISTGSSIAVPAFLAGRRLGLPRLYLESIARVRQLSLTGRIVHALRLADVGVQYPGLANRSRVFQGNLLDQFGLARRPVVARPRLLVTLGTIQPYRFDALVDAVLRSGVTDETTVWQLGSTKRSDLPGQVFDEIGSDVLMQHALRSDVVVTHSGAGTVLDLLQHGIYPVVVPRRHARGEHVDDHQTELAEFLREIGLAHVRDAEDLDAECLREASGLMVQAKPERRFG